MVETSEKSVVEDVLFSDPRSNVYAVLNGAAIDGVVESLSKFDVENCCLFSGDLAPSVKEVAPHLVQIKSDTPLFDWLVDEGWGRHWGIFAVTRVDFRSMRKHCRTFLRVRNPKGKPVLFRYFDPRIFRLYLPTCNTEEVRHVFGPVRAWVMEGEAPGTLLEFRPTKAPPRLKWFDLKPDSDK